ncbi:MAG: dephospho-CoA kinase [bacterium]
MLKVGVTGGIGSGKSSVSNRMKELGAYVFDADAEAKHILDKYDHVQEQLIEEFGTDIVNSNGSIHKKRLALRGFANEDAQSVLNAIIHPFVFNEIDTQFEKINQKNVHTLFIVDAALIYESGLDQHLDYVIVVTAQLGIRIKRAMERSSLTRDEIQKRIDLQLPEETKVGMADFVIENNGTEEKLIEQVNDIYKQLI